MNKYINADKLFTKIVELKKELPNTIEHLNDEESGFARGQQYELTAIEAEILCLQQEQSDGVDGVVHHALKSHWIVTDKNKLAAILKAFPEGAEVELFITAKKEKSK